MRRTKHGLLIPAWTESYRDGELTAKLDDVSSALFGKQTRWKATRKKLLNWHDSRKHTFLMDTQLCLTVGKRRMNLTWTIVTSTKKATNVVCLVWTNWISHNNYFEQSTRWARKLLLPESIPNRPRIDPESTPNKPITDIKKTFTTRNLEHANAQELDTHLGCIRTHFRWVSTSWALQLCPIFSRLENVCRIPLRFCFKSEEWPVTQENFVAYRTTD